MKLLNAIVGGLCAGAISASVAVPQLSWADDAAKVDCYGINKCKGMGACGASGSSCAGNNACKHQGFIELDSKETCLKIDGGSLKPLKGKTAAADSKAEKKSP